MIGWALLLVGVFFAAGWVAIWLNSSALLRRWLRRDAGLPYVNELRSSPGSGVARRERIV